MPSLIAFMVDKLYCGILLNFFIVSSLFSGILFKKSVTIDVLAPLRDANLSIIAFVMFNSIPPYTGIILVFLLLNLLLVV